MEQDRPPFLQSLGLPAAWAEQPQWRILDTGLGNGERFLAAWHAWKADPRRPRLLHYVALEAGALSAAEWQRRASPEPELAPLAEQLRAQCFGLLPGFHRMAFEGGCVLLTVCVGETKALLREQQFEADAIYLADIAAPTSEAAAHAGAWDLWTCKALAHCCRRGTALAAGHGVPPPCAARWCRSALCWMRTNSSRKPQTHGTPAVFVARSTRPGFPKGVARQVTCMPQTTRPRARAAAP